MSRISTIVPLILMMMVIMTKVVMVITIIMIMTYIIIIVIMMMTTLIVNKPRNVETLVRDVNSHMRQRQENLLSLLFHYYWYHHYNYHSFSRQEQERLKTIIARIDSYEPIETKDEELQVQTSTKQHCNYNCVPSTLFCLCYI